MLFLSFSFLSFLGLHVHLRYDAADPPYVLSASLKAIEGLRDDYASLGHFEDRRFGWTAAEREQAALMFLGVAGTSLSGSISTILTVSSWICAGIYMCGALPSPVCA